MKHYRHLRLAANTYYIRQTLSLAHLFIFLFILTGFILIFFTVFTKTGWVIIGILTLCFILSQTTHKSTKKIILENGKVKTIEFKFAQFRPSILYQVRDIHRLTVRKIYYMHIPINIELLAELKINGQQKTITLSQSISVKIIQELYNELEDLLELDNKID